MPDSRIKGVFGVQINILNYSQKQNGNKRQKLRAKEKVIKESLCH